MAVPRRSSSRNYQSSQFLSRRISGVRLAQPLLQSLKLSEVRFEYTTPRIRITPNDFKGTPLEKAKILHFICSPSRTSAIMSEVEDGWKPLTVYEPIPVRHSSWVFLTDELIQFLRIAASQKNFRLYRKFCP